MSQNIELNIKDILWEVKLNLKRAGWKKDKIQEHLIFEYHKDRVLKLTDDEMLEFLEFCKKLPDEKPKYFKGIEFRKLPSSKSKRGQQTEDIPSF